MQQVYTQYKAIQFDQRYLFILKLQHLQRVQRQLQYTALLKTSLTTKQLTDKTFN